MTASTVAGSARQVRELCPITLQLVHLFCPSVMASISERMRRIGGATGRSGD